jgi:hypothetical protein
MDGWRRWGTWDPLRLSLSEKAFWEALWDGAPFPMLEECGLDMVRFGPIQAGCIAEVPLELGVNFLLGSGEDGAVEHGHLANAVSWLEARPVPGFDESIGVDFRVPIIPGLPGSASAERWLRERGAVYEQGPVKLVRNTCSSRSAPPAGIEVWDWNEWDEGFPEPLVESLGLPSTTSSLFVSLPITSDEAWRCYGAVDEDEALAYAAMHFDDSGMATLALASRPSELRDGAGQAAILQRCIRDAEAAGCDLIAVADAGQDPPVIDRECLIQAGFEVAFQIPTWRSRVEVDV